MSRCDEQEYSAMQIPSPVIYLNKSCSTKDKDKKNFTYIAFKFFSFV